MFQLVIAALKCHKYDKSIQVTGSAALFYLTNTEYRSDQSVRLRREVIQVVLNGMEQYQEVTVSTVYTQAVSLLLFLPLPRLKGEGSLNVERCHLQDVECVL